jgi:hypothetical protein
VTSTVIPAIFKWIGMTSALAATLPEA